VLVTVPSLDTKIRHLPAVAKKGKKKAPTRSVIKGFQKITENQNGHS
jgi:hypothetical protein